VLANYAATEKAATLDNQAGASRAPRKAAAGHQSQPVGRQS
jgi:hypothetical protein